MATLGIHAMNIGVPILVEVLEVMEIASVLGIHAVTSAAPILAELAARLSEETSS